MKSLIYSLSILVTISTFGQQTPAPNQTEAIAIEGATLHLGNGQLIENGLIIFEEGLLTYVGTNDVTLEKPSRVIDAKGKHVYPGFILPVKSIGLVEIDAVRATDDQDELGEFIPHVRSLIAYNAESQLIETFRQNGVLLGQITPSGGRISGSSSVVQFDAWNWEDAAIKVDDGIHLNWPSQLRRGRWWMGEDRGYQSNKEYLKQTSEILEFLKAAKAYHKSPSKEVHLPYQATKGLFNGEQRLYVFVDGEREIQDAVSKLKDLGIEHLVIVGGYHAEKQIQLLKSHGVPVLVHNPHELPEFADDSYDFVYGLAARLHQAGVLVGIQNAGKANFQARNLPFYAGHSVGYGISKEDALSLITLNTAKILGIDALYGSLEVGKSATLFISEGDALDMRTNQLTYAFIDGRNISLESHQTELWKRYMGKYANQ